MFVVIIVVLIFLSSDVYAFQVSPASITQTSPEQTHNFLVRVDTPSFVEVQFEGDLAAYAQAEGTFVNGSAQIPVVLSVPELSPGRYELLVVLETQISQGEVGANAQLVPKISYVETFEGSYVVSSITPRNGTSPLELVTLHENLGDQAGEIRVELWLGDTKVQDTLFVEDILRKDYSLTHPKGVYELVYSFVGSAQGMSGSQMLAVGEPEFSINNTEYDFAAVGVLDVEILSDWNVATQEDVLLIVDDVIVSSVAVQVPGNATLFWEGARNNATAQLLVGSHVFTLQLSDEPGLVRSLIHSHTLLFIVLAVVLLLLLLFKNYIIPRK